MRISDWQPPQGYRQVESSLPGVTVFAPAPQEVIAAEQVTFKCPRCGAETAYDPDAGSVTCSHCGYVQAIQAEVRGESATQEEFTMDVLYEPVRGWGEERRELHCESCGADLSV